MIKIELDSHEAHLLIAPLTDYVAQDEAEAARTKGEESEYAGLRAQVRKRVLDQIVDGLIPDPTKDEMRWQHRLEEARLGIA